MFNFMYQLEWAKGCPDIWSDIILDVSVGVFWTEVNIQISSWVKQIGLPNVGGAYASVEDLKKQKQ